MTGRLVDLKGFVVALVGSFEDEPVVGSRLIDGHTHGEADLVESLEGVLKLADDVARRGPTATIDLLRA